MSIGDGRKTPATYADLVALPPNVVGQIVDGELITLRRPSLSHANTASRLAHFIGGPFAFDGDGGGPGGWRILVQPELHLGPDVLVPDLAGWRLARMPEIPVTAATSLAPDWACEVLSPSTQGIDRVRKRRIYAREGVGHLWFVDAPSAIVEVFRLHDGQYVLIASHEAGDRARIEPFEAVELDVGKWFVR